MWQKRVGGAFAASPIYGDGRIYFCDQDGQTTIIKPGREFESLATNTLDANTVVRVCAAELNPTTLARTGNGTLRFGIAPVSVSMTSSNAAVGTMVNTPQNPTTIYTCVSVDLGCSGPQTDVAVRQALDLAMDRTEINEKAFAGLSAVASPTFALLGRDDRWISPDVEAESPQTADPAAASAVLEEAGYTKGADGIYEKDGQRVEMTIITVDGWNDYNAVGDLLIEQAKAAGISIIHEKVTQQEMSDARVAGNYQLMVGGITGPVLDDPFSIYRQWLTTDYTRPVGEVMESGLFNYVRYTNPTVDAAVEAAAATNVEAEKQEQYAIIQKEIVNDLPYIPVVVNATQTFVDTKDFTGWPTEDNLYAFPPSWDTVSLGIVLSKLEPAG